MTTLSRALVPNRFCTSRGNTLQHQRQALRLFLTKSTMDALWQTLLSKNKDHKEEYQQQMP